MPKLFCYEDSIVIVNEKTGSFFPIEIPEREVKEKILEIIEFRYLFDTRKILSIALEQIIGLKLAERYFHLETKGKKYILHDSMYYRRIAKFIENNELFQLRRNRDKKRVYSKKSLEEKIYKGYINEQLWSSKKINEKRRRRGIK